MKNWTTKEFVEHAKGWNLDDGAGAAVFSDHLIEIGQIRWANMLRWAVLHKSWRTAKEWTKVLNKDRNWYTDGFAWDNWTKFATARSWHRIPDQG